MVNIIEKYINNDRIGKCTSKTNKIYKKNIVGKIKQIFI